MPDAGYIFHYLSPTYTKLCEFHINADTELKLRLHGKGRLAEKSTTENKACRKVLATFQSLSPEVNLNK
jgi:hypothetical protein